MTLHFLNDVANDAESIQQNRKLHHNRICREIDNIKSTVVLPYVKNDRQL